MYKITYIPTGHIFLLPENEAKELKEKYPDDYKILEKNGKKFKDKVKQKISMDGKSIYSKVVDK